MRQHDEQAEVRDQVHLVVTRQKPVGGRARFAAEFRGGPHNGQRVENMISPEDAVGELIMQVADHLGSPAEVLTFLAGLFGDLRIRSPRVILARAVWIAAKHPRRENRGVTLDATGASKHPDTERCLTR